MSDQTVVLMYAVAAYTPETGSVIIAANSLKELQTACKDMIGKDVVKNDITRVAVCEAGMAGLMLSDNGRPQ